MADYFGVISRKKGILTVSITSFGGALEFFDFTVFLYLTPVITNVFFPDEAPRWIRELAVFAIFAVGWLIRPIGGTILAYYGDKIGRKRVFVATLLMMGSATFLTGLIPSYASIGVFAPALLVLLRVVQGFAIGAEVPGALTYISEHVSERRLGLSCGLFTSALYIGLLFGSLAMGMLNSQLTPAQVDNWGWRLPFLIGGILAFFVGYMRLGLTETPTFERLKDRGHLANGFPIRSLVQDHLDAMGFALLHSALLSIVITGLFMFLPTPLVTNYGLPSQHVFDASTAGICSLIVFGPVWGAMADRLGFAATFCFGSLLTACAAGWFFYRLEVIDAEATGLTVTWIVMGAAAASVCWLPAIVTRSFPPNVRFTGFALPYNVGLALFTGLLPGVVTILNQLGSRLALFFMVAAVSLIAICVSPWVSYLINKRKTTIVGNEDFERLGM